MENISDAIAVSAIAMGVIFLVLSVLIATIKMLVHFIPYTAPPKPVAKASASASAGPGNEEEIAVITAALSSHLRQQPGNLHIKSIREL
ncbi:MAG: hypothetical protein G3M78_05735 [Candidatus Nitrohelix vancouverensis]|uniref:Oxaloacetate decarboxylase gamma chain n=1 Tax=Candidatus Nitrohelix vancouverensis TaxID=2705534 RepID=A0A7T0C1P1_9BACT|nr:MAG: hypothetical protein G3M78_05735 [Candidatus Nitrohelix vancouverensis]